MKTIFGFKDEDISINTLTEQKFFYFKGYIDSLLNNNYSLNKEEIEYKKNFDIAFNKKFKNQINEVYEKMFNE